MKTEIAKALTATTSSEKDLTLDLVQNKGNLKYNIKVLTSGKGELILARRKLQTVVDNANYLLCIHCFIFFVKEELWRHIKRYCRHRPDGNHTIRGYNVQAKAGLLLDSCVLPEEIVNGIKLDPDFKNNVIDSMANDDICGGGGIVGNHTCGPPYMYTWTLACMPHKVFA